MEKKKLLLMVPMLHQGGFERVCVETARILKEKRGDQIDVEISLFSDEDINYDIKGLTVINLNIPARDGKIAKAKNVLARVGAVRKLKKSHGYDYCYSFGSTANLINALTRGQGKTLVGLRSQIDLANKKQIRFFAGRADKVVCCSGEIQKQLKERYGITNTSLLYNPISDTKIREKAKDKITDFPFPETPVEKIFVSLGREDDFKGYWHLIKAFSLVHEKDRETRLLIVGEGTFAPYQKLAQDLGILDAVSFPGVRKNPFPYLARCGVYVTTSNIEGFPNALREAMALGLPVISTDCRTGPSEILCETMQEGHVREVKDEAYGVLIPDMDNRPDFDAGNLTEDDRVLAGALTSMLENPEKREHYAAQSLKRVQTYSPESYAGNLMQILQSLD